MSDAAAARDLLLEMVAGPRPDVEGRMRRLDAQDWEWIGAVAAEHRLGPLLASRFADSPTPPPELVAVWTEDQLRSVRRWLKQRKLLHELSSLLGARGLRHLALKGAWLALGAYPSGATRPLRDLDLLVDDVPAASQALHDAGFRRLAKYTEPGPTLPADLNHAIGFKSPGDGTLVELHHRVDADWRGASLAAAEMLERAATVQLPAGPLHFPAPEDNFLHLVAHAALHHRFDNGPLLLSDLACLCEAAPLDWRVVQERAASAGLSRAVGLVLQLLHDLSGKPPRGMPTAAFPAPPSWATTQAKDLLVQRHDQRWRRRTAADSARRDGVLDRTMFVLQRTAPKRRALSEISGRAIEDPRIWLSTPAWYMDRGRKFIVAQLHAESRRTAEADARVDRWLTGG
ncbi:MAG: nucleotidyltransferase family protein [Albimonas sp.]|uniref:nucleotidyltransferase family protein n=1 Tax=Albimonas sp. TaxID=1872425 RepID=UPI00405663C5|tara:strand:+ start:145 stop:1347 length:1203 start_codon:yes stop_codon:yes gene_type:complete